MAFIILGRKVQLLEGSRRQLRFSGHNIASSNEVTLNSRCCWENTKTGLNSGSAMITLCPDITDNRVIKKHGHMVLCIGAVFWPDYQKY